MVLTNTLFVVMSHDVAAGEDVRDIGSAHGHFVGQFES